MAHGVPPPGCQGGGICKEEKGSRLGQGRGHSITAASQQEELGVTRHTLTPAHTWLCHLAARVPEGMPRAGPGEVGRGTGRGLSHTLGTLLGFQRFAWPSRPHSFQKEPSPQVLSVSPSPSLHRVWHLLCHPLPLSGVDESHCTVTVRTGQGRPGSSLEGSEDLVKEATGHWDGVPW